MGDGVGERPRPGPVVVERGDHRARPGFGPGPSSRGDASGSIRRKAEETRCVPAPDGVSGARAGIALVDGAEKRRDLGDDLVELRATCARLGKGYGPAYDYAYGLRRSGNGQVKVKTAATDPTSTTYATGGRTRGLLRRLNSKVQAALRDIEDAEAALDEIYEQGLDVRAIQAGYVRLAARLR